MKKILIVAMILLNISLNAQKIDTSTYAKKVEYLFSGIEKPTKAGIWYDKVTPWAELQYFGTEKNNIAKANLWKQARYELQALKEQDDFLSFNNAVLGYKAIDVIPFGVINTVLHYVDSNAVKNGVLTQERPNLPYKQVKKGNVFLSKSVFMAALLQDNPLEVGKTYRLALSKDFVWQQHNALVRSLEVQVGSEKYSFTPPYNSKTINFTPTQVGKQIISFKATFEDGTIATTQAEIVTNDASTFRVGVAPCYTPPIINPSVSSKANIVADIPFQAYTAGSPSIYGMGEVAYYYANSKTCANNSKQFLTKPVIFIDGFDALDKREISEIYEKNLAFDVDSPSPKNLGDNLRNKNYDLIVLNFPIYKYGTTTIDGGTDYIERNAMVLVRLIQQVNTELAANGSTEKLVIVGPSMGGLISKYALAYMEKVAMNHNTRLWISFDAPHHGANIPIGAQQFLKYYADVNTNQGARESLENKINSVAAKQMVVHHHLSNSTTGSLGTGFWPFRGIYRGNADGNGLPGSNGFPMNVRKLAIASGSQSGVTTGNPGDKVLHLEGEGKVWALFIFNYQVVTTGDIRMSGGYGNTVETFYGWTAGRSNWHSYNASEPWMQSLDTSPGGLYNTAEEIAIQARSSTNNWFITERVRVDVYNPVNCFIPTKSALSFSSGGTYGDSAENLTNRSLVCSGETPFDAYYAPLQNEGHIQLNAGNVAWIMPELDGIKNVNAPPVPVIIPINHLITAASTNTNCINQPQLYQSATNVFRW